MNMVSLSSAQMREAANVQDQIEAMKLRLAGILNGQVTVGVTSAENNAPATPGKRRKMSAAARQKMSESAQARWAKQHKEEQDKALGVPNTPAGAPAPAAETQPQPQGEAVAA